MAVGAELPPAPMFDPIVHIERALAFDCHPFWQLVPHIVTGIIYRISIIAFSPGIYGVFVIDKMEATALFRSAP